MIIDHAGGLHEGVDNGGAHKIKARFLQGLGHGFRFRGGDGDLGQCLPPILDRPAVDELPEKLRERDALIPQSEEPPGIADDGMNFQAIPDNARVCQQAGDIVLIKADNLLRVKAGVGLPVAFLLAKDGNPA